MAFQVRQILKSVDTLDDLWQGWNDDGTCSLPYLRSFAPNLVGDLKFINMGLLARIFSTRHKTAKRLRSKHHPSNSVSELGQFRENEADAAAHRLLRSSSARFAVIAELDSASLPPIREL